ncbi:MAG TPA: GAF domain-containing protein [Anaerolineales bacterium]
MLILGIGCILLFLLLLKTADRVKPEYRGISSTPLPVENQSHDSAVLLIEMGGRVFYSNSLAQEWFDLQEDEVNLESLVRRTRPNDVFLALCASEGQGRFSLEGRLIQGFSYLIPYGSSHAMMVSLQRLQLVGGSAEELLSGLEREGGARGSPRAYFEVFSELSQSMATNLDLDACLKSILESIEHLIPADYAEVTIWEPNEGHLIPYRLFGTSDDDRHIEQADERYSPQSGFSGYLIAQKSPLLVPDVETFAAVTSAASSQKYPLQSYLGAPLFIAGELIGTLELGSTSVNAFTQEDLEVLKLIAGQAAIAINNALLYQEEQQRAQELAGLAHLAQVGSKIYDEQDLFTSLVKAIRPLLEVEIIGFLTYDESRRLLKGQAPFWGLPSEFIELYQTTIPEKSPAEEVWLTQEIIHSVNAPEDPRLQAIGLDDHAMAAGINETILMPLASSERKLGYLQVANKLDGTAFDQNNLRFLIAIAGQAALILENANLFKQSKRRAQRAEALRRIASLASSVATKDEILKWSLHELARLIQADAAAIFLLDESNHALQLHQESLFGLSTQNSQTYARLSIEDSDRDLTVTGSQQAFFTYDASQDIRVLPAYRPLIDKLKFRSAIDVPLVIRDRGIGEIMFGSYKPHFFNRSDIESVATAAGQLAGAIEQAALAPRTDEDLQPQAKRTTALTRLHHILAIAKTIGQLSKRSEILISIGNELLTKMEMDSVLVAEAIPGGLQVVYSLGKIPPDVNPSALLGQRNPIQDSFRSGEKILVSDIHQSSRWQNAPLLHNLNTRSFTCLPITIGDQAEIVILAISRSPLESFTVEDEKSFDLLTQQASMALQTANQITETQRRLQEVTHLLDFSRQIASLEPNHVLQSLVDTARQIVPAADAVTVAMWDPEMEALAPRFAAGYANVTRLREIIYPVDKSLPGSVLTGNQPVRLDEVDFAHQYKLPQENLIRYRDATGGRLPLSSLLVPISSSQLSKPSREYDPIQGVLILDSFSGHEAFSSDDQSLVASLAHQTAITLENVRLYQSSEQRTGQIQALTSLSAIIASNLETEDLVASLLDQMQSILPFDTGTLWMREGNRLSVRAVRGFADTEERVGLSTAIEDSQFFNEMSTSGEPIYVRDVRVDARFPAMIDYENLSWAGVPMIAKGEMAGVIALEKREVDYYTPEDLQLGLAFASQVATALENANLYKESLYRAQELDKRSQRLALLNRLSTTLSTTLELNQIYRITLEEISRAVDCSRASMLVWEDDSSEQQKNGKSQDQSPTTNVVHEFPSNDSALPQAIPYVPIFNRLRQTLGVYAIDNVLQDEELAPIKEYLHQRKTRSLLVLPMSIGDDSHEFLLLHNEQPHHYSIEEVELLRTISNQAAIAIENARLFNETRRLTQDLEQRVNERTAQLAHEHQRIATLLRIITELSASLDLEHVLNRTLQVLNEVARAEQIECLVWRPGEPSLQRVSQLRSNGSTRSTLQREAKLDRSLAGWVIANRKPALINDGDADSAWQDFAEIKNQYHSAMGVPLMVGEELVGALLLYHSQGNHFTQDQLELIQATGNQIAVTINNAELYNLIRDQAEDLGNMLRTQQIETSRTRAILESVADGVLVTDDANTITLFNDSAEKLLGLDGDQVVGRSLEYFTGLFGRAARSWMSTIRTWSSEPSEYQPGETYSERIDLENGRVVSVQLAPAYIEDEFLGTVSIFHDITHQVEVDRLKTDFVATVSHELRTPMTSIKGYVDILLMGAAGALGEQQEHFLKIVKENTLRLTVLVNDLLDISRIEANKVKLALQPLDLRSMAEDTLREFRQRAGEDEKPIKLVSTIPSDIARVTGDPDRIRQILTSLLDNAYHYTPESGVITLHAQPVKDQIQVNVIDTGIGIPREEQEHVFERFFRGENSLILETSGTGLGLPIVQQLVNMHGGTIWLESSGIPGEGSTFSFTLPVYNPTE